MFYYLKLVPCNGTKPYSGNNFANKIRLKALGFVVYTDSGLYSYCNPIAKEYSIYKTTITAKKAFIYLRHQFNSFVFNIFLLRKIPMKYLY